MTLYFGTYTRRVSEGIYVADFNAETGELSNRRLVVAEPNPTYLALSADQFLYSVGTKGNQGGIAAFSPDLDLINHVVADGAPHCYVSVDEERQLVYGANYHKGQVLVYKRLENGGLELADSQQHEGSGPHENQASPHVHFADLTPDKYLVTCDLGTDQVITYTVSDQGKLGPLARYQATPGAGPRHIVFHPTAKIAYLICELNSTIEVLIYDGLGEFELMQTITTLPSDYTGFNGTAAIRISQDGKFLYSSNRGHHSIAIYKVLGDASLELVDIVPSLGKTPRDFILSPDNRFLIVAHQDSDNISVFGRDEETGKLTNLSSDFIVPEAVCITFA
ncbi:MULTISPECIES: lactonase family protein [unclassified Streptococcus]|uniref:lactonase family protein n=1 Tax=unclassified Streptococcus TaxID=2608887 RepID=UPI0018841E71|nr:MULTISPECIES: lactonase family protein [unclassified Streptococcus]MBF0786510.1 lactonase family protein [Streptococcus sp. 19428wC2_LYSM12]MCQ9212334.1 lactonase family protein [Streptococcus sp. B01]MCQ9213665.1 lactonase family protein [Streptococcus sp. O1]